MLDISRTDGFGIPEAAAVLLISRDWCARQNASA
jgi:hypothetical protein